MRFHWASVLGITATAWLALAAAPQGWFLAGSKPANYDTGVDPSSPYLGRGSSFLKAKADQDGFGTDQDGFGTLMQSFSAKNYAGKRLRLSGYVKSDSVTRWAGVWMRVDGPSSGGTPEILAFDNMQNRPIKGSTDWQNYQVVLDVPNLAAGISFGILLDGPG
jgi:hypothetical protein